MSGVTQNRTGLMAGAAEPGAPLALALSLVPPLAAGARKLAATGVANLLFTRFVDYGPGPLRALGWGVPPLLDRALRDHDPSRLATDLAGRGSGSPR